MALPISAPEGVSLEEVAWEALKDAEEVFGEEGSSATPNPPAALIEDSLLCVEDFIEEGRVDPTPSKLDDLHAWVGMLNSHHPR